MRKLIRCATLVAAIAAAPGAWAADACTTNTGSVGVFMLEPVTLPSIDPNVADWTPLVTRDLKMNWGTNFTVTCPGAGAYLSNYYEGTTGPLLSNNVYQTAIPGIGVRLRWTAFAVYFPVGFQNTNPYATFGEGSLRFELVKTGPITQSGTLTGEIAKGIVQNAGNFQFASIRISGGIEVSPKKPTCSVATPSVVVKFPPVPSKVFTGIGSFSPEKPFSIGLTCSGGVPPATVNVAVTLTDQTNLANLSDTLSLTPTSTAKGVGIQVLNGTTVVQYGPSSSAWGAQNQWVAGVTGNGSFSIPLNARYVQTGQTVTPGSANGLATFTMSYQ